jgi:L-amino acid N-acyltransferase YncA
VEAARLATPEDVPRLAELAAESVAEQAEARGGAIWSQREARALPADESLRSALGDPSQLVLAGTIDGAVVGYAVVAQERLRTGALLGVLRDIYVEPQCREVGVGEALVDEVIGWCRSAGCVGIDALALPGNRETKNFFESFGFTARALIPHRKLV